MLELHLFERDGLQLYMNTYSSTVTPLEVVMHHYLSAILVESVRVADVSCLPVLSVMYDLCTGLLWPGDSGDI